jgi:hypothetical protein
MTDVAELIREETADIESVTRHIRTVIDRLIARDVERGAALYVRERDLPPLLGDRCADLSTADIILLLKNAARLEAQALIADHWSADPNRLLALRMAIKAEEKWKP